MSAHNQPRRARTIESVEEVLFPGTEEIILIKTRRELTGSITSCDAHFPFLDNSLQKIKNFGLSLITKNADYRYNLTFASISIAEISQIGRNSDHTWNYDGAKKLYQLNPTQVGELKSYAIAGVNALTKLLSNFIEMNKQRQLPEGQKYLVNDDVSKFLSSAGSAKIRGLRDLAHLYLAIGG